MTDTATGTAGKIQFETGTITLDNGGSTPIINFTTGGQFDNFFYTTLAGSSGVEKIGAGIAQFDAASNSYTGITKISQGGIRIRRNSSLGDVTVGSGVELAGGTLYLRQDAGTVVLANGTSAKRNVSVTAGTNLLNLELTNSLEISGNLSSLSGTLLQKVGAGTLVLSGSGNSMTGTTDFRQGTVNIPGTFDTAGQVVISKNNTNVDNATLNWSGTGNIATAAGSTLILNDGGTAITNATLNVTAGTLNVGNGANNGTFIVGGKGVGTANIIGGNVSIKANKDLSIGSFFRYGGSGGNGTLSISNGGVLQALGSGGFFVGYGQDAATLGGAFGGTGALNLNGGTLETGRTIFTGTNATGTVNLNGGTLKAAASNANWIATTNNTIGSSGVAIDTAGYAMGISQPLQGTGALTKTGAGALALNAANTYAGGTTVSSGTLAINNPTGSATGSGALSVASGAILTGNGAVSGSATINGTLSPGSR